MSEGTRGPNRPGQAPRSSGAPERAPATDAAPGINSGANRNGASAMRGGTERAAVPRPGSAGGNGAGPGKPGPTRRSPFDRDSAHPEVPPAPAAGGAASSNDVAAGDARGQSKVSVKERLGLPGVKENGTDGQEAPGNSEALTDTAVMPAVAASPAAPTAPAGAQPSNPARPKPGAARRTRKARLRLSRLDPWSVMKTSFLFSIAAGIMLVVAVYVVWTVIGTSGLFNSVNDIVKSVVSTPGDTTPFRIQEYINTQKVMGVTALLACVDVVIFTALATLGSFLYNLAATMLGGLEVTLAED